ncbi:MAG: hypothetical protein Ct9H300mP13_1070 [Gammaproteobacteria bacterium]|nr:MAG: hypothetical protein Ct9H300mP13_1070 [Gammaproteobacteria bacterium]
MVPDASVGDEVVLIGHPQGQAITLSEVTEVIMFRLLCRPCRLVGVCNGCCVKRSAMKR